MKLIVAVIAKDRYDFKEYFEGWRNNEIEFYFVSEPNQIRGIIFNGVIITERAKYLSRTSSLYNECLRNVR